MKIKPLNNHILVSLKEKETKRSSGILIPTDDKNDYQVATVERADGSDIVNKGDTVLLEDFAATKIKVENKDVYFVKEEDIVAVYE